MALHRNRALIAATAIAGVLVLAACSSSPKPHSGSTSTSTASPTASPAAESKPISLLGGDCSKVVSDANMSAALGETLTGRLNAPFGAGLAIEVFGGIECAWDANGVAQVWLTVLPAASVHDAASEAPYCYSSDSGSGSQAACSFGTVVSGIWLAGVVTMPPGSIESQARTAVADLEKDFATSASGATAPRNALPTGSWPALPDCAQFSTAAGIPAAAADSTLSASAGNLPGEAGPGYYAAASAAGYSSCIWSGADGTGGFTMEFIPGAGWFGATAMQSPKWVGPVSVAGATAAGQLGSDEGLANTLVVADGVNLLLLSSNTAGADPTALASVASAALRQLDQG